MKAKFNKAEQDLIKQIEDAKRYCKGELELNHIPEDGGWIAMDYRIECQASFHLEKYDKPLISDDDVKRNKINVVRCCDYCNVYYVG